jgi:hypothetical protein
MTWTGWPSIPPDAFTELAHALYSSSPGTLNAANGEPEQLQMNPTLIGAPVVWPEAEPVEEELGDEEAADVGLADEEADVVLDEEDLLLEEQEARESPMTTTLQTATQLRCPGLTERSSLTCLSTDDLSHEGGDAANPK